MSRFNGQPRAAQSTTRHRSPPTSLHQPHRDPSRLPALATDADGVEGSNTHVIVVNSPPSVDHHRAEPIRGLDQDEETSRIAVSDPTTVTPSLSSSKSVQGVLTPLPHSTPSLLHQTTPQMITLTVTATDSDRLATVETAQITIVPNQPPTLSITVPNALEIGQIGNLRATVGDPTNDPVTIRWDASTGVQLAIGLHLNTTITVPRNTGQTITVTCTATDDRGATTTQTATITVRQPNRPPTVSLNVPATASPGQTVNIEAIVD